MSTAIDRERRQKNLWKRRRDQDVRDIYPLPKCVNRRRRNRCKDSLRKYLLTYHADRFSLKFSEHHEHLIASIERAILHGLQEAIGFPRGSGKTTICQLSCLWSTVFGHRKHVKIFGCEEDASNAHLDEIKNQLMENQMLFEDFPEIVAPIRCTEGNSIRARGQLYKGRLTKLEINSRRIIFPITELTEREGNAGAVIAIATLTGSGARGSKVRGVRPDLALVDDPQTRKSASSESLVRERMSCLTGDILGMEGPASGASLSVLVTCTVIKKGDLADQILNRRKHPEWHGIRIKMIESDPINVDLWMEWKDICRAAYIQEQPLDEAHAFYRKHRRKMDEGAKVYWEDRYSAGFVSAIEQAMFFRLVKFPEEQFASEFQNEPIDEAQVDLAMPEPEHIMSKALPGRRQGVVPLEATKITAFVDVQKKALWYVVVAWRNDFTGWVIDYGTYPDQRRRYYTKRDQQRTLAREVPGAGIHGCIHHGLERLLIDPDSGLANIRYEREDGLQMPIDQGLVDANWGDTSDVVYSFLRAHKIAPRWHPSHGEYNRAQSKRLDEFKLRPGEESGPGWKKEPHATQKLERVRIDTNWWKTFHCQRWMAASGDPGCMYLFEGSERHRIFADHLNAEFGTAVTVRDRTVTEWTIKPGRPDNEFLDGMVGCCVGASMSGVALGAIKPVKPRGKRKKRALSSSNVSEFYG